MGDGRQTRRGQPPGLTTGQRRSLLRLCFSARSSSCARSRIASGTGSAFTSSRSRAETADSAESFFDSGPESCGMVCPQLIFCTAYPRGATKTTTKFGLFRESEPQALCAPRVLPNLARPASASRPKSASGGRAIGFVWLLLAPAKRMIVRAKSLVRSGPPCRSVHPSTRSVASHDPWAASTSSAPEGVFP